MMIKERSGIQSEFEIICIEKLVLASHLLLFIEMLPRAVSFMYFPEHAGSGAHLFFELLGHVAAVLKPAFIGDIRNRTV